MYRTHMTVLVTGASGNVGRPVVDRLVAGGIAVRRADRSPADHAGPGAEAVRFDFTDPSTWPAAFAGVETVFLVRPPALGDVRRDLLPAVAAARDAGVGHVVFLSLQGAERIPVVPHATVERWLRGSGMSWTFVRPSFSTQNLSTTHAADIRDRDELVLPAGDGRTAFVDTLDVADVVAAVLAEPRAHRGRAWTVTGPEALTHGEVADALSEVLGRRITYRPTGVLRYVRHARTALGMGAGMAWVTAGIYTTARLGLAAGLTGDVRQVTGRDPRPVLETVRREAGAWRRPETVPREESS
ncbi:SDR family NAD(P)-dependent oxidoreductase [Blastococcus sp. MG754426]|nr:SDR family NAD(P)-dependent oxidoreductase [Blastococcus sp. MG754426]MCF6511172.1 SDR family NAD(P)-dependent oxidoreductase [Blastococcus sp. MG754427]